MIGLQIVHLARPQVIWQWETDLADAGEVSWGEGLVIPAVDGWPLPRRKLLACGDLQSQLKGPSGDMQNQCCARRK